MIKYILIAILANGQPMTHEFSTMQACASAEAFIFAGNNESYAMCVIDDQLNPVYTDRKNDGKTSKNPLDEFTQDQKDDDTTDDVPDIQPSSGDLPIHKSNDDLPIHKD